VLTLKDLNPAALTLIKARAHEIAAVLVSPLQGLNPGSAPPSDLVLMAAEV
jgi:glutamate-1-semialdehyde aminotransferase